MLTLDQINRLNPWWTDDRWAPGTDPHLAAAAAASFTWDPRPFAAADLTSAAVFTLRGPRQSGKTTLTKRLIADRVAAGLGRRTCFLTLQTITTPNELQDAIETVLRLWPAEAAPWLFVLDELTFVKGWAKVVAHLREHDRAFRLATVILTGSSAVDLVESADILHGRRGRSDRPLDRLHMPMTFRDYVGARAPAAVPAATIALDDLLSPTGRDALRVAALRTDELDQYLIEYAHSGGLPAPVTDMLTDGALALGTVTELWRGLSADVRRLNRNEATLAKLVARTVVGLGSLTNFADLMRDMDVAKATAAAYVDLLAKSFALVVLHQRDAKRQGGPSLTRARKHYFGDTGFAAIPAALGGPTATDSALVENLVALALLRHSERDVLEHFAVQEHLFIWRSADGREIDFLVGVGMTIPLECKYATHPTGKDYESMTKAFGRGIMASRRTFEAERPILTVPVGVLLAVLG